MTEVSYLIVAYRSRETIGAAIRSILEQTGAFDKEIVVIDNSAGDNCAAEVLKLAPQAKVTINRRNLGFTHGVNQAVEQAGGDYLFLMNPDVKLSDTCTRGLLEAMKSRAGVGAAAPQLRYYDGRVQRSIRNFPDFRTLLYEVMGLSRIMASSSRFGSWRNPGFDYTSRAVVQQPMASALLLTRESASLAGCWDEQFFVFFSDVDYCRRLVDHGFEIIYEPDAVAYHLGGGATRQEGSWLVYDSHSGYYRYLTKHVLAGRPRWLGVTAEILLIWGAVLRDLKRRFWGGLF